MPRLRKGDHVVVTSVPREAVALRARGYHDDPAGQALIPAPADTPTPEADKAR